MPGARVDRELSPPELLQIAGHPLRWRLLEELARSDRLVHELTERTGESQNLVSYHLGKLRAAGLVSARRSSADGRDTYYRADLVRLRDQLASVGTALHPGLAPASPSPPPARRRAKPRVLFLCTGNSGRSPMAEAILRARSGGAVDVRSAGSHPKPLRPEAVQVLRSRYGIDIDGRRPRNLEADVDRRFDWVISLCDRVREACPELPGAAETIHWSIPDPAAVTEDDEVARLDAFERTATELEVRIDFLLHVLDVSSHPYPSAREDQR